MARPAISTHQAATDLARAVATSPFAGRYFYPMKFLLWLPAQLLGPAGAGLVNHHQPDILAARPAHFRKLVIKFIAQKQRPQRHHAEPFPAVFQPLFHIVA
jgi:hypothetical protein